MSCNKWYANVHFVNQGVVTSGWESRLHKEMLAPAAALALWTLVMMGWMLAVTGHAFRRAGLDVSTQQPGSRGADLTDKIPAKAQWPSHNYTHLAEQPTAFYPVVVILALVGGTYLDLVLAWSYVGLRVGHSIWQATVNRLPQRFAMFFVSSLCLAILAIRALLATL